MPSGAWAGLALRRLLRPSRCTGASATLWILGVLITVCSRLLFSLADAGRNIEQSSSERGLPIESSGTSKFPLRVARKKKKSWLRFMVRLSVTIDGGSFSQEVLILSTRLRISPYVDETNFSCY